MQSVNVAAIGLDELHIDGIHIEAVIGFSPHELDILQPLEVDLVIRREPRLGASDDGECPLDYRDIKNDLRKYFLGARYRLIESFAESIARRILALDGALDVLVTVHKPAALTGARGVAVRIRRCLA